MLSLPIDVMRIIARTLIRANQHRPLALACTWTARAVMLERKHSLAMFAAKCDDLERLVTLQPNPCDLPALLQQAAQFGSLRVWMYLAPLTSARVHACIALLTESSRQNRPDALRIMYERCIDSKTASLHIDNRVTELRDWVFALAVEFEISVKLTARSIRACWPAIVNGRGNADKVWEMIGCTQMISDEEIEQFVTARRYIPAIAHGPHQIAWMFEHGYMPKLEKTERFFPLNWIETNGHKLTSSNIQAWLLQRIEELKFGEYRRDADVVAVVGISGKTYNSRIIERTDIRPLLHAVVELPAHLKDRLCDIDHVQAVPRLWRMSETELNEDRDRIDDAVIKLVADVKLQFFIDEHGAYDEQDAIVCLCRLFHRRLDAAIAEYYRLHASMYLNACNFARYIVYRDHLIVDKTVKEIKMDFIKWIGHDVTTTIRTS